MRDTCSLQEEWSWSSAENQDNRETGDLFDFQSAILESYIDVSPKQLTISPSLASADSRVCGASRCLSIPSKTSTNFSAALPDRDAKHSLRRTASVLTCSHLPLPYFSHSSRFPNASNVAHSIFVNRWRPVMHSVLRTMACGTSSEERTARTMVDLHVADIPCTTNVAGLGPRG